MAACQPRGASRRPWWWRGVCTVRASCAGDSRDGAGTGRSGPVRSEETAGWGRTVTPTFTRGDFHPAVRCGRDPRCTRSPSGRPGTAGPLSSWQEGGLSRTGFPGPTASIPRTGSEFLFVLFHGRAQVPPNLWPGQLQALRSEEPLHVGQLSVGWRQLTYPQIIEAWDAAAHYRSCFCLASNRFVKRRYRKGSSVAICLFSRRMKDKHPPRLNVHWVPSSVPGHLTNIFSPNPDNSCME